MLQVCNDSIDQVLHNLLNVDLGAKTECAATHILVRRVKILTQSIDGECELFLHSTVYFGLLDYLPVEEKKFLDAVVRKCLQVGENGHQKTRVVLVVRNDLDERHQSLFLLWEGALAEHIGEFACLWLLNHIIVVDDEVALPSLFFNGHLFFSPLYSIIELSISKLTRLNQPLT